MKEDYLWDKTGKDPEIEKLERTLTALRCREDVVPPAFSGKVLPFRSESPSRRRIFSFPLAAACVAFAVIALGVWLQISRNKTEIRQEFAEAIAPQNQSASLPEQSSEKNGDSVIGKPENPIAGKVETAVKHTTREKFAARKFAAAGFYRQEKIEKNDKTAEQENSKTRNVRLTKEEQYAYNQLLLALSITGSQLKLVQDKIDGIEEQTADIKTGGNFIQEK